MVTYRCPTVWAPLSSHLNVPCSLFFNIGLSKVSRLYYFTWVIFSNMVSFITLQTYFLLVPAAVPTPHASVFVSTDIRAGDWHNTTFCKCVGCVHHTGIIQRIILTSRNLQTVKLYYGKKVYFTWNELCLSSLQCSSLKADALRAICYQLIKILSINSKQLWKKTLSCQVSLNK